MRKRISEERGQALVIIALAMVGLIAFLALVIDGGVVFAERRHMQNAADAAALAGVRELYARYEGPHSAADEQAIYDAVIQYAQDNGVEDPASNLVAYFIDQNYPTTLTPIGNPLPTNGGIPADALGVEVTTSTFFGSFFARVIGRNELGASAVAASILEKLPCAGPYAVWADSYNCGAVTVNAAGSDITIFGSVHSNDGVKIQGSASDPATITGDIEYCGRYNLSNVIYGDLEGWPPEWCDPSLTYPKPWDDLNIDISRFASGDLRLAAELDNSPACLEPIGPIDEALPETSCYHGPFLGNFKPGPKWGPLPDGLYYVDGNVHIKGSDLPPESVNITIVATGSIRMEGVGGIHVKAYSDLDGNATRDLLLFSNKDSGCNPFAINISSDATKWTGIIFAPLGKIDISGSNLTSIDGAVWGYSVNLSGSFQSIGWTSEVCEYVVAPDVFLIK